MKKYAEVMINFLRTYKKGAAAVIGFVMFLPAVIILFSPLHEKFEYTLYDMRFIIKPAPEVSKDIVLLNIDDPSITIMGEFPWPRSYYAEMLDLLGRAGLDRILFDIQFMDYSPPLVSRNGMETLMEKTEAGGRVKREDIISAIIDNDVEFGRSVKKFGAAYIPYSFPRERVDYQKYTAGQKKAREKAIKAFHARASIAIPEAEAALLKNFEDHERLDIQYPIPEVSSGASAFGFVDSDFDSDGTARRVRLVRTFNGRIYFHLGFKAAMDLCGVDPASVVYRPGKSIIMRNAFNPATGRTGDISIPVDNDGTMLINWAGGFSEAFRQIPAYALFEYDGVAESVDMQLALKDMATGSGERAGLAEQIETLKPLIYAENDPVKRYELKKKYHALLEKHQAIVDVYIEAAKKQLETLKVKKSAGEDTAAEETSYRDFISAVKIKTGVDAIFDSTAVIGLTASGSQDIGIIPLSNEYMMVGTYPNVINTILTGNFIKKVPLYVNLLLMFLLAMGISLIIYELSSKAALTVIGASFILLNGLYILLFAAAGLWLDQLGANLAMLFPSVAIIAAKFTGEEKQKRFIKDAFSKYLSPRVIDQIIKNPDALNLGGETREITIFFSDVAGFSSISETLSPEQLVQLLNEYLSDMTDIILKNYGTVDKYEGDAIMAFWGAPYSYDDHAYRACLSAVEMQRRLSALRAEWKLQGRHELYARMGINTGSAVAGNMGSRTRMNYTVMGDSVNLASRLEGANKFYSTYAMVSEFTAAKVSGSFVFRDLDVIRVVGKKEPIKVFELIEEIGKIDQNFTELLDKYNEGLDEFRARNWMKARNVFHQALKLNPGDGPSRTYVERCSEFLKNPPSARWDGVYTLKSK